MQSLCSKRYSDISLPGLTGSKQRGVCDWLQERTHIQISSFADGPDLEMGAALYHRP